MHVRVILTNQTSKDLSFRPLLVIICWSFSLGLNVF